MKGSEATSDNAGTQRYARSSRVTHRSQSQPPSQRPNTEGSGVVRKYQVGATEVNVDGVEPMTSVTPQRLKRRDDVVTDGNRQQDVLANAPDAREGFFAVPKVVE